MGGNIQNSEEFDFGMVEELALLAELDEIMVTRIAHQIDQRCGDIHPKTSEGLGGKSGLPDYENA
jgi:hypothetical protein